MYRVSLDVYRDSCTGKLYPPGPASRVSVTPSRKVHRGFIEGSEYKRFSSLGACADGRARRCPAIQTPDARSAVAHMRPTHLGRPYRRVKPATARYCPSHPPTSLQLATDSRGWNSLHAGPTRSEGGHAHQSLPASTTSCLTRSSTAYTPSRSRKVRSPAQTAPPELRIDASQSARREGPQNTQNMHLHC